MPWRPAEQTGLAAQLRLLRLRAGLTQEALAEKAGVSVATIGAIEEGQRRRPYPNTLRALADSLELSAAERAVLFAPALAATDDAEDDVSRALRVALPVPPSALIGRESERAAARALLLPPANTRAVRLLTLLGPGGVGKTRLSFEIVATVREDYADGAAFVDLAPIHDYRLVPATVARVLGVRESGGRSVWELVLMHMRSRRALIVLDNFEHVLGATPLVAELLGACPDLTLLVTSRTALRVRGEQRMVIGPLSTTEAVRLFVERVREVSPQFSLDDGNVATVAEICRRLDGMPLALELAAARTQLLTPLALLHRLDDRLNLLSSGPVDLPERQRTLRNTLTWSYDLLGDSARALFRRLAVFAGGWTLDAAAAVGSDADMPARDALHQLGVLIDCSLVRRLDEASGEPRFGMHEIVREYALERLQEDPAEEQQARTRHLGYWLSVAETAEPHIDGPGQMSWLDRLERDLDNLRAALTWSVQGGAVVPGLRLATALLFFWYMHGHLREGRDRLQAALESAEAVADPPIRGRALAALGYLLAVQRESGEARSALQASLAVSREMNDGAGAAFALRYLGFLAAADADHASATELLKESLTVARGIGSAIDVATALMYLGDVTLRHDFFRAREMWDESASILRQLQNHMVLAYPLRRLGWVAQLQGDVPLAVRLCVESLNYNRSGGELLGVAGAFVALAPVADSQGRPELAVQLLSKAEALADSIGGQLLPFEAEQFDASLKQLRNRFEPRAWAEVWEHGRQMTLDEAIRSVEELAPL